MGLKGTTTFSGYPNGLGLILVEEEILLLMVDGKQSEAEVSKKSYIS